MALNLYHVKASKDCGEIESIIVFSRDLESSRRFVSSCLIHQGRSHGCVKESVEVTRAEAYALVEQGATKWADI